MEIHQGELADVNRYIAKQALTSLEEREGAFQSYLRLIRRFKAIDSNTSILEIGTGTGWFPLLCRIHGIACRGLEISPQLVEHARQLGRGYGIEPDIQIGNIEAATLGTSQYDVILAFAVFEHVQRWRDGFANVYGALKPEGIFVFSSPNKFALKSVEYGLPFYGWLPDRWRYRLRIARQGPDIMKLGIDFNQFTPFQLRRAFFETGFSKVLDRIEAAEPAAVTSRWRRWGVEVCRRVPPVKNLALLVSQYNLFVCVK